MIAGAKGSCARPEAAIACTQHSGQAKSVEYMIVDALKEANSVLKISEKVNDVKEYWKLDDTIVKQIEISSDPRLQKSRDILRRLRKRELYRYVNEFTVPGLAVVRGAAPAPAPAPVPLLSSPLFACFVNIGGLLCSLSSLDQEID